MNKQVSQCAIDLCIVDGQFSMNIFGMLTDVEESVFDPMMSHDNFFDTGSECKNDGGDHHDRSERSSCGSYPNRYLFKTMGGERACCGERTFNTNMMQCCDKDRSLIQTLESYC